jgi:hypothetical protein
MFFCSLHSYVFCPVVYASTVHNIFCSDLVLPHLFHFEQNCDLISDLNKQHVIKEMFVFAHVDCISGCEHKQQGMWRFLNYFGEYEKRELNKERE